MYNNHRALSLSYLKELRYHSHKSLVGKNYVHLLRLATTVHPRLFKVHISESSLIQSNDIHGIMESNLLCIQIVLFQLSEHFSCPSVQMGSDK